MPIVGVLFVSFVLLFAYTGSNQIHWNALSQKPAARMSLPEPRVYVPPARKSILVSPDGQSHTVAGMTHMTKRDRSRVVEYRRPEPPKETLSIAESGKEIPADVRVTEPVVMPAAASVAEVPAVPVAEIVKIEPAAAAPLLNEEVPVEVRTMDASAPVVDPVTGEEHALMKSSVQSDLALTLKIQNAPMADETLTAAAKHLSIVTIGGRVTLRGFVSSEDEMAAVESLVLQIAGPGNIDNKLEISA